MHNSVSLLYKRQNKWLYCTRCLICCRHSNACSQRTKAHCISHLMVCLKPASKTLISMFTTNHQIYLQQWIMLKYLISKVLICLSYGDQRSLSLSCLRAKSWSVSVMGTKDPSLSDAWDHQSSDLSQLWGRKIPLSQVLVPNVLISLSYGDQRSLSLSCLWPTSWSLSVMGTIGPYLSGAWDQSPICLLIYPPFSCPISACTKWGRLRLYLPCNTIIQ